MGADCEELQKDLMKHNNCKLKWEMKFSINRCVQEKIILTSRMKGCVMIHLLPLKYKFQGL